jgi:L-lactate utilization protein LutC
VDRDLFLERVGASLRRSVNTPPPEPSPSTVPVLPVPDDREGMLELFAKRLHELQGVARRVPSRAAALADIAALLLESYGPDTRIACPPSLVWPAIEERWTADPRDADFGLSEAEWGIAASATVVLRHRGEHGRAFSLVPPAVGFLLPVSRLMPRLAPVVAAVHDDAAGPPACITFVSGASHSSDIAGISCFGVHGPADVRVWLIEDE